MMGTTHSAPHKGGISEPGRNHSAVFQARFQLSTLLSGFLEKKMKCRMLPRRAPHEDLVPALQVLGPIKQHWALQWCRETRRKATLRAKRKVRPVKFLSGQKAGACCSS